MDYDFSGLCGDQLDKLQRRLESLSKAFMKEYVLALNVINNNNVMEHKAEIFIAIENVLHDQAEEAAIRYSRTLNVVQGIMKEWIV